MSNTSFRRYRIKHHNFVDTVVEGTGALEDIDKWVYEWHNGGTYVKYLHKALGLTKEDYEIWVQYPERIKSLVVFSYIERHRKRFGALRCKITGAHTGDVIEFKTVYFPYCSVCGIEVSPV